MNMLQLVRTIKENHVPYNYMHSELRKLMYRRYMLKNNYRKDKKNNDKFNQYERHRNKCVLMSRKAIKDYLLFKCKPGSSSKEFFDAVGPFMNNKCRLQRNIILKENDQIITDTTEL